MKRYIINYTVADRLVAADIEANNLWEALQNFDALDISVDETLSIARIPQTLVMKHEDRKRRNETVGTARSSAVRHKQSTVYADRNAPLASHPPMGRSKAARFGAKYNAATKKGTACPK